MDLSSFLIIIIIFIIFLTIGFMINDTKYKIAYFMCIALLSLSALNVYLSIIYYIELRNAPGVPGVQGTKGPVGAKGNSGKCSFTASCKIENARDKILNIANTMYGIDKNCIDKPTLSNCGNSQDTLDQAMPINSQVNMLEQIAYSTTMAEEDFMSKLNVCLQDSNSCMDPTDF